MRPAVIIEAAAGATTPRRGRYYLDCLQFDAINRGEAPMIRFGLYPELADLDLCLSVAEMADAHLSWFAKADYFVVGMDLGEPGPVVLEMIELANRHSVRVAPRWLGAGLGPAVLASVRERAALMIDELEELWHCKQVVGDMADRAKLPSDWWLGAPESARCSACRHQLKLRHDLPPLAVYDPQDWIDVLMRERAAAAFAAIQSLPAPPKTYSVVAVNQLIAAVKGKKWRVDQLIKSVHASFRSR